MGHPTRGVPEHGRLHDWLGGGLLVSLLLLLGISSRTPVASGGAAGEIFGVTRADSGVVSVDLTPTKLQGGRLAVEVRVTTNTAADLDAYDLVKITRLRYGGTSVAPSSAPKLHGHHRRGELVFPLTRLPDGFTIEIDGLYAPGQRVFSWP